MAISLLDVNVLVALLWRTHTNHQRAHAWFQGHSKAGWATCPLTQAAAVRILSNPVFSRDAFSVSEAIGVLSLTLEHPDHEFWEDDIGFVEAVQPFQKRLFGHQQIADAYLLGLTMHRKGKFVTMDQAVLALLPQGSGGNSLVTVI